MTTYPTELRMPDHINYNGQVTYGLNRTTVPAPIANQLKYFGRPRVEIELSFSMTNDEMVRWLAWMRQNGMSWFDMPVVSPHAPVKVVSTHQIRFTGDWQADKRGDNWYTMTGRFELLQGEGDDPLVPARADDWIIAGTPASPSTDWMISGTPASPSADWIRGEIYYY